MPLTSSRTTKVSNGRGERNQENPPGNSGAVKRLTMTVLGSKVWGIICKHCGERGILHPLDHFAEQVVFLTARQFRTRFDSDKNWYVEEIQRIYAETKNDELIDVISEFIRRKQ